MARGTSVVEYGWWPRQGGLAWGGGREESKSWEATRERETLAMVWQRRMLLQPCAAKSRGGGEGRRGEEREREKKRKRKRQGWREGGREGGREEGFPPEGGGTLVSKLLYDRRWVHVI